MHDISEVYKNKLFKSAVELREKNLIVNSLMLFKIQGTLLEFFGFIKNELGTEIFEAPITSPLAETIIRAAKYDDENGPFVSFLKGIK